MKAECGMLDTETPAPDILQKANKTPKQLTAPERSNTKQNEKQI